MLFLTVLVLEPGIAMYATTVYPTRVRATFVDAETNAPIAGVTALSLSDPGRASEADFLFRALQDRAQEIGPGKFGNFGVGTSGADGAVEFRIHPTSCRRVGFLRGFFTRDDPPPFFAIGALLVEKEGYGRHVIHCTKGTWTEHDRKELMDLHATVDLGEVRLQRVR